jgi:hypothetical protein
MILFHSFNTFGRLSKELLFVMNALKWAPEGLFAWLVDRDKRPGMARLRENKVCAHEVAVKLIDEKRQGLEGGGSSRKDILSLLGPSTLPL